MKQFRVIEDKSTAHSETDVRSPIVAELHAGDEVGIRKAVKVSGVSWCAVTLADGRVGYVAAPFKGIVLRRVTLAQRSVDALESPAAGSKLKVTYTSRDEFTIAGLVKQGETQWVEIRTDSGDVGFIPTGTKIIEIEGHPEESTSGCSCFGKRGVGRDYQFYFGTERSWTETPGFLGTITYLHIEYTCLGQEQAFVCNQCAGERISSLRCDNMYLTETARSLRGIWLAILGMGGLMYAVFMLSTIGQGSWMGSIAIALLAVIWAFWMFRWAYGYLGHEMMPLPIGQAIDRNIGQIELLAGISSKGEKSGLKIWTRAEGYEKFKTANVYTTSEKKK